MDPFDESLDVPVREGNRRMHARIAGLSNLRSGGLAILLHGAGFTGMSWAFVAEGLRQSCCVVVPDFLGHGLSSSPEDDLVS